MLASRHLTVRDLEELFEELFKDDLAVAVLVRGNHNLGDTFFRQPDVRGDHDRLELGRV